MREAHSVEKIRRAERELMTLLPDGALMERAATGLAAVCAKLLRTRGGLYGRRVVVLAGSGDNGGDALFAGTLLSRRGARVTAVAAGTRVHGAGAHALREAGGLVIRGTDVPDHEIRQAIGYADLIVDGMLGIGGKGGLREPYATLATFAAQSNGILVAADLPSGIDADTGVVAGPSVRADVTVTFGTYKAGLFIDPGASRAGVVELVDIGLDPYLLDAPEALAPQAADVASLLPHPGAESDKYRRGVLGLLAGSERFTGAAMLATGGAIHGGAGMVRLVTAPQAAIPVRNRWPEVVITELGGEGEFPGSVGRVQAWVAGPGMGITEESAVRLADILATSLPVLVDADGLSIIAQRPQLLPRPAPTLLTPHAGELARLVGANPADVAERRLEFARLAATRFGACVLLAPGLGRSRAGQPHGYAVAGNSGYRGRARRPRGRPARPGPAAPSGGPGRRLPARRSGPPSRRRTHPGRIAGPHRRLRRSSVPPRRLPIPRPRCPVGVNSPRPRCPIGASSPRRRCPVGASSLGAAAPLAPVPSAPLASSSAFADHGEWVVDQTLLWSTTHSP
jgi:hydroxyethylthiazole kinase-like uncharacterized protein yjeF